MSGPWEEFQTETVTSAPPPAAQAPAPAAEAAPWEEFAAVEEVAAPPPPQGAASPEELQSTLRTMLDERRPLDEIKGFVRESNYQLAPDVEEWLDQNYEAVPAGAEFEVPPPEQREDISNLESAWAGAQSGALRGFDDEWQSFWGATGNKLGTALGLNETPEDMEFWSIYDQLLDKNRDYKDEAYRQNTLAYGAGFVPGMLTGPSFVRAARGGQGSAMGNAARAGGIGAVEGALSGAGNAEGGLMDRAGGALTGSLIGAVGGTLLHPLTSAATTLGSRLVERLPGRGRNNLNTGLDALVSRAPQDAEAMTARLNEMEAAGVPARVVDVVDESGRGVIRDAGSKMTPAREELARAADTVYVDAQDRVANQARRNISPAPNTARQVARSIREEQQAMGPRFDAVRDEPVTLTPELIQAMGTAEGRTVLNTIARYMTPAEQDVLRNFSSAVRSAANIDPRMPEAIRQQMMQQVMEGSPLTVDIADKFARVIRRRAGENPGLSRVAEDMANTVRGAARQQHPAYDDALVEFEGLARVADAAEGAGRFEGTDFLRSPPDEFARITGEASPNAVTVEGAEGPTTFPSEQVVNRVRARDEVVDKATSGSGAQAMATARQLSRGSAQRQRNEALLGPEGADQLARGMAEEVTRVDNTRFIDPRTGSQTQSRQQDAEGVNDLLEAGMHAGVGNKWGMVASVRRWMRSAGIRGVDAERLVRDAISEDPARVREAIDLMTQRGVDVSRARSLVRAISATAAGRAAGALTAPTRERQPPNSVRAMLKQGTDE